MRQRWTTTLVIGMLLAGAFAAGRAGGGDPSSRDVAPAPAATAPEPAAASPAPPALAVEEPRALAEPGEPTLSVTLTSDYMRQALVPWYERLGVEPSVQLASIPAARRDPPSDASLGQLTVRDEVEVLDGECPVEIRKLVAFDLGEDGSPRIHDALALLAAQAMVDVGWVRALADGPCDRSGRPWAYQEVEEVACAIPDGRPYRCLTITTSADGHGTVVHHAAVDVRSGKLVDLGEIVAQIGGGGEYARRQVAQVLCAQFGASEFHRFDPATDACPSLPARFGVVPTTDGLTVLLYDLFFASTRDVLEIPWEVLAYRGSFPTYASPTSESLTAQAPRGEPDDVSVREAPDAWMVRLGVSRLIPMDRIPAELADPALPKGLGPLTVTAEIQRARRYCAAELRHIVGLDFGPGSATARIAADLVAVAAELRAGAQWITTYDEDWCVRYGDRRPWSYQELAEEACELPGGPDVRCFTLTQFTFHEGDDGAPFDLHQPVYDVVTGERLRTQDVLARGAGTGASGVDALASVGEVLCRDDVLRRLHAPSEIGRDCTEIPVTRAHPTADGVWIGLTGRDDLQNIGERYFELFVPWEELAGGAT